MNKTHQYYKFREENDNEEERKLGDSASGLDSDDEEALKLSDIEDY